MMPGAPPSQDAGLDQGICDSSWLADWHPLKIGVIAVEASSMMMSFFMRCKFLGLTAPTVRSRLCRPC